MELHVTLDEVKDKIQEKEAIPPDEGKLIFNRTLADYNIPTKSNINFTLKIRNDTFCYIIADGGKKLLIDGYNDFYYVIFNLKKEIEKKLGIRPQF